MPGPRSLARVEPDVEVQAERLVSGGEALAREGDGQIVLVRGGLSGERLLVEAPRRRSGARRAEVVEVLDPSPHRVVPACPWVGEGCGGCDLQHLDHAAQPAAKVEVVRDALHRLGGVDDPVVSPGAALAGGGFRTTVRAAVRADGRAGFRRHRSHEVVAPDACLVAHPLVEEVLVEGRFPGATEVVVRAGAATGERLVVVRGPAGATGVAEAANVPDDVVVVGSEELRAGRRAWIHEEVAGRRWRVSAGSFFQARPDGAEALVAAVRDAAGEALAPGARVVDAYAGVGLLGGALTSGWSSGDLAGVQAVERSSSSASDARRNLVGPGGGRGVRVVRSDVDRWRASRADLVVADPARAGLGRRGAAALTAAGAPVLVLVSCDPGALGRDAKLLAEAGYVADGTTLVDMFPHTHHVEAVTRFRRA